MVKPAELKKPDATNIIKKSDAVKKSGAIKKTLGETGASSTTEMKIKPDTAQTESGKVKPDTAKIEDGQTPTAMVKPALKKKTTIKNKKVVSKTVVKNKVKAEIAPVK
jgi:hypothetical protein